MGRRCGEPCHKREWLLTEVERIRRTERGAEAWARYTERNLEGDREADPQTTLVLQDFVLGLRRGDPAPQRQDRACSTYHQV